PTESIRPESLAGKPTESIRPESLAGKPTESIGQESPVRKPTESIGRESPVRKPVRQRIGRLALAAGSLLCFFLLCAFTYARFSELNGDDAAFAPAYQGDGKFEIVVFNESDKELRLQDSVKVMQWSTGEEVEGDSGKIRMTGLSIPPCAQGIVTIDLSEGYDVAAMEENLPEGDYYFILTNDRFAFGQTWMCFFDFEIERTEEVRARTAASMEQRRERQGTEEEKRHEAEELAFSGWIWPTVSREISGSYGSHENGIFSDHVNIVGTAGDEIYAVADGVVMEAGYDSPVGNFILVDLGDGVTVKYGHLKERKVSEGEEIKQGQVIATMGRSGMATGPNLLFAVSVNGEAVNPLAEQGEH
ncbi:MAG: M23 family metallopeptidase, partial [Ruminococcus flavefaciens]|nr:M23 family metallopeptidase [Ruminococcus flavefaciens]